MRRPQAAGGTGVRGLSAARSSRLTLCNYAEKQGVSAGATLARGMEEKAADFVRKRVELYHKA